MCRLEKFAESLVWTCLLLRHSIWVFSKFARSYIWGLATLCYLRERPFLNHAGLDLILENDLVQGLTLALPWTTLLTAQSNWGISTTQLQNSLTYYYLSCLLLRFFAFRVASPKSSVKTRIAYVNSLRIKIYARSSSNLKWRPIKGSQWAKKDWTW